MDIVQLIQPSCEHGTIDHAVQRIVLLVDVSANEREKCWHPLPVPLIILPEEVHQLVFFMLNPVPKEHPKYYGVCTEAYNISEHQLRA